MAKKIEGTSFEFEFEQVQTFDTLTVTSGTDSPATRMSFFIAIPPLVPRQEAQVPAKAQSHRA